MIRHPHSRDSVSVGFRTAAPGPGQSGEAHVFLTQDNNLTAKVPLRRSILQCNLQQKYRSTGKHNPQRDDGPEKRLYRLRPIALVVYPLVLAVGAHYHGKGETVALE